jgi:hypothetical protein
VTSIPDAVELLSAQIRADLQGVSDRIEAEQTRLIEAWPELAAVARRRLLREVQARVLALAAAAGEIARVQLGPVVGGAYRLGAEQAALTTGVVATFGGVDTAAVAELARDAYADVLAATQHISDTTKELVRTMARERIADKLLAGQPPADAARRLRDDLQGRGIAAITYRDGARHQLGDYTDMLVRTKTAEATQAGGFGQARALGIEWMELMDGPGCGLASHRDARKANGLILTVDEAARYPLSHPRCRRVASPRPDITSAVDARAADPIGPQYTAEQIAAAHRDSSVTSPAAARARSRVAARSGTGTLVTERGMSAAERRNAARMQKRTGPPAGRP